MTTPSSTSSSTTPISWPRCPQKERFPLITGFITPASDLPPPHGLDASITLGNKPWDTAAGVLLAREAGATVVDADGTAHGFHSAATIAAAGPLISQLLPLIQATDANTLDSQQGFTSPYAALDAILAPADRPYVALAAQQGVSGPDGEQQQERDIDSELARLTGEHSQFFSPNGTKAK